MTEPYRGYLDDVRKQREGIPTGRPPLLEAPCPSCGEVVVDACAHQRQVVVRIEPGGPPEIDGHVFGHHPDDRDPWDALLADVKWVEGSSGPYQALVVFWRKEARKA